MHPSTNKNIMGFKKQTKEFAGDAETRLNQNHQEPGDISPRNVGDHVNIPSEFLW